MITKTPLNYRVYRRNKCQTWCSRIYVLEIFPVRIYWHKATRLFSFKRIKCSIIIYKLDRKKKISSQFCTDRFTVKNCFIIISSARDDDEIKVHIIKKHSLMCLQLYNCIYICFFLFFSLIQHNYVTRQ